MAEPFLIAAGTTVVKEAINRALKGLGSSSLRSQLEDRAQAAIQRHVRYVSSWASQSQTFGATEPSGVALSTIPLHVRDVPRRFRDPGDDRTALSEDDLLSDGSPIILLGDPGAGKTTTVRRLASRILRTVQQPQEGDWSLPVLVLCRTLTGGGLLDNVLPSTFGIDADARKLVAESSKGLELELRGFSLEVVEGYPSLILIDGIDECPPETRRDLEHDIEYLGHMLTKSKIVVTCRSGDAVRQLEGFRQLELSPLDDAQIVDVAARWFDDRTEMQRFLDALTSSPSADLADRPLFLTQLIIAFQRNHDLPEQPSVLSRQIVALAIRDWDDARGVVRLSDYGRFHGEQKQEFLATLALDLLGADAIRFNDSVLQSTYARLAPIFRLPTAESAKVAREIESHTGIIVQVGSEYEFAHLSLQEYLAASALVRRPVDGRTTKMLSRRPSLVAIAVALSSEPSEWLAHCLDSAGERVSWHSLRSLFDRLDEERPWYGISERLGMAILRLLAKWSATADLRNPFSYEFMTDAAIRRSVVAALEAYRMEARDSGKTWILRIRDRQGRTAPETIELDAAKRELFVPSRT